MTENTVAVPELVDFDILSLAQDLSICKRAAIFLKATYSLCLTGPSKLVTKLFTLHIHVRSAQSLSLMAFCIQTRLPEPNSEPYVLYWIIAGQLLNYSLPNIATRRSLDTARALRGDPFIHIMRASKINGNRNCGTCHHTYRRLRLRRCEHGYPLHVEAVGCTRNVSKQPKPCRKG